MSTIKAVLRFAGLIIACLIAILVQKTVLLFTKGPISYIFPPVWHRWALALFGVKLEVVGEPVRGRQVIYVSNHISYLDIPTLGAVVKGSFVSRGDVKDWPGWGFFGTLQQVQYISRSRADTAKEKDRLGKMISDDKNLIIFGEGTSTDGRSVLPFKSSFFTLAVEERGNRPLLIQPVTLSLLAIDGHPVATQHDRDVYTWYGDMTLPPHFWRLAHLRGARLQVRFHPPRDAADFTDRKVLAAACHADVLSGLVLPDAQPMASAV